MDSVVAPQEFGTGKVLGRRKYGIDTRDAIRSALAGYVGGTNIIGELVQNADDGEASKIQFYFSPDALTVKNDSYFTDKDFDNILAIASGGKRDETGRIGTWGTGFLSVYHLTDSPELHSAGQRIRFDPSQHEVPVMESRIGKETMFIFRWRREQTELSRRIEGHVWPGADVQKLLEEVGPTIYRQLLFLRCVKCVEVYDQLGQDGQAKLLYRVQKRLVDEERRVGFTRERWEIEYYQRAGNMTRVDSWFYYRGRVPESSAVPGVTIKDFGITVAFPMKSTDWLSEKVPSTLYNFLPTPILTSFGFQLNGAFFPDSNRRTILFDDSTQPEKSKWNRRVIEALGNLIASKAVVLDIRDRLGEARRFYEVLPVRPPNNEQSFLRPLHGSFASVATEMPIVFSSLRTWCLPREVYVPQGPAGSRLRDLAAQHMAVLPTEIPEQFLAFLRTLPDMPQLTWRAVVEFLTPYLEEGRRLTSTHSMINTREKLKLLYSALPQLSFMDATQMALLAQSCLCLAEDDTVCTFSGGQLWSANANTRQLLKDTGIRFVHPEVQSAFPEMIGRLVPEFRGASLVEWLAEQDWPDDEIELDDAPSFIHGTDHLSDLLRFIASDLKSVSANDLEWLPLVLTEANTLVSSDGAYLHNDPKDRAFLTKLGMAFVHQEFVANEEVRSVYRKAGVEELEPRHVIRHLQRDMATWSSVTQKEMVDSLRTLYDYFIRHARQLSETDVNNLKQLPLCMDQQGNLVSADAAGSRLYLSPASGLAGDRALAQLDTLQLKYIVHSDLQVGDGSRFLRTILGLTPLSAPELIEQIILPHYSDFPDTAKLDLLFYISEQLRSLTGAQSEGLLARAKECELIRCEDGSYKNAKQVYFASAELDSVFGRHYLKLHPSYGVAVQGVDGDQARNSKWYWLFSNLGVNETPAPIDLVAAVEREVIGTTPTDERTEIVRRIYNLLNETERGKNLLNKGLDALRPLASMRWLPATNDRSRWFLPSEVYPSQFSRLVGRRAPILAFNQTSIELRKLLPAPTAVPPSIIANHLLDLTSEKQEVPLFLYEFLGNGWDEINPNIQRQLREAPVVWDGKRHWLGRHVLLGDYNSLFGSRRCYFSSVQSRSASDFLRMIGAKERPDGWLDQIALLREIAEDYHQGTPANNQDRALLLSNFDHLGRLQNQDELQRSAEVVGKLAVVPDLKGVLHLPDRIVLADRPDLLEYFDNASVSIVIGSVPAGEDVALSETAYRYLVRCGVPRLSRIVHRKLSHIQGSKEDDLLGAHLRALRDALLRVAISVHERQDSNVDVQKIRSILGSIRLFACSELTVEYVLQAPAGWRVQGHRRREHALYDERANSLYVVAKQYSEELHLPLAKELTKMLDLTRESITLLKDLLKKSPAEVDAYLTELEYPKLYADTLSISTGADAAAEMVQWDAVEESWFKDGQETVGTPHDEAIISHQKVDDLGHNSVPLGSQFTPNGARPRVDSETTPREESLGGLDDQPEYTNEGAGQAPQAEYIEGSADLDGKPEVGLGSLIERAASDGSESLDEDRFSAPEEQDAGEGHGAPDELDRYVGPTRPYDVSSDIITADQSGQIASADGSTAEIPAFTGQVRPAVPVRPNNYSLLKRKYGLTRHGDHDVDPQDDGDAQGEEAHFKGHAARDAQPVTEVRFVLKFANRYEGFLPLHSYARRMFPGRPSKLRCQVEYGDQEFDLYVDYDLGIIYNQHDLPALFDEHNIPAGGVVYLKLVHGTTVRLYWRREKSLVKQVLCLEMGEDGSVQEFLIDAAEYTCEIAEYVLRAEKRFEDAEALFKEALDKDGLLETMCDIFGEPDRELAYDAIFHGVQAVRKVAKASIDFQLYQRPCFVQVKGDLWRFEPRRGYDPYDHVISPRSPQGEPVETRDEAAPTALTDLGGIAVVASPLIKPDNTTSVELAGDSKEALRAQEHSPRMQYDERVEAASPNDLFSRVIADLQQVESLIVSGDGRSNESLLQLAKHLERLARQITALAIPSKARATVEPSLLLLWQQIGTQPRDEKSLSTLINYIGTTEPTDRQQTLLASLRDLLLQTGQTEREYTFWPLLSRCAERAFEAGLVTWARHLYQLLTEEGAGDFSQQLEKLGESTKVEEYLDVISNSATAEERWEWIHEAWSECNAPPRIRTLIQNLLNESINQAISVIEQLITQARVAEAFDEYIQFTAPFLKVADAWSTSPHAFQVWTLAGKLVGALERRLAPDGAEVDAARETLMVVAQLPEDAHKFIPPTPYLRAAISVSRTLEANRDPVGAALLLEYAIQCFGQRMQTTSVELSQAHQHASRLYQQLEAYSRAYSHLSVAHSLEVARGVPYGTTKKIGWRCSSLRAERDNRDSALEQQIWLGWVTASIEAGTLDNLVSRDIFVERMRV